jgi:hypothetical protein
MNLATVLDLHHQPADLPEIRLAADRDSDPLAIAILKTPDPAETVEALHAYAVALEDAYPGCDPRVDLGDLSGRAVQDHRLDALVAVLETP